MNTTTRVRTDLANAPRKGRGATAHHKLPVCPSTGLARHRDRHQARDGAAARDDRRHGTRTATFACPDCGGYHLEVVYTRQPIDIPRVAAPSEAFVASLTSRKRRYVLVDVENLTSGAQATPEQVARLWSVLSRQAPGITARDHVVVGAARSVARRFRAAIHGANVRWVVGADAPDGADHALLAAIDLHRVAKDYDELVIMSGDHAFADLARRAKSAGLSVHVVTVETMRPRPKLSRELAAAADTRSLVRLTSRAQRRANLAAIHTIARRGDRRSPTHAVAA